MYNKSDHPWEMSQVACPEYRINGPDNCPPGLELALQEAIATMPDRGRWSILVPVVLDSDQQYTGQALDRTGKKVTFTYSARFGLVFT